MPCISINYSTIVWWDGDVSLCQSKKEILGNLYEKKFDEIWNSERTKELQKKYLMCNDCWIAFHRVLDTKVSDLFSSFPLIKKFLGL
jgi:radical SAM protein with 4Fe4S-binding SPASM domain